MLVRNFNLKKFEKVASELKNNHSHFFGFLESQDSARGSETNNFEDQTESELIGKFIFNAKGLDK